MPPKKSDQIDPNKDSASQGDLPRKKSKKVLRWVKVRIGDKIRKRRMLVKKPTPYPIKGGRVPKVRPHNRMSLPIIGSSQRREETRPACQPGQEGRYLMTTSQLGATMSEGSGLPPMRTPMATPMATNSYIFKGGRVPKIRPHYQMPVPMSPQPSTQRREATPSACQPGQEESYLMTTSQLGATMSEEREPMPTPMPRVSKIMPHSRMPTQTEASTQRREGPPPPCPPGQEEPSVMTTSQLGGTMSEEPMIPPLLKGIIVGVRLFQQYNHELGQATSGDGPTSSHVTPESLMQRLAQYEAQGLSESSLEEALLFGNPSEISFQSRAPSGISSFEMQISDDSRGPSGFSWQPGSAGQTGCRVLFKNKDIQDQTESESLIEALAEYQAQGSSNSSLEGSFTPGSSFEGLLSGNPSLETQISDDSRGPSGFSWQPGSAGQMTDCAPCLFNLQQYARHVDIKPEPDAGQDYYNQCPTARSFPFMNRNIHTQAEAQGSEHLPGQTLSELSFGAWMDLNFDLVREPGQDGDQAQK